MHKDADAVSRLVNMINATAREANGEASQDQLCAASRRELLKWSSAERPTLAAYDAQWAAVLAPFWGEAASTIAAAPTRKAPKRERRRPARKRAAVITARTLQAADRARRAATESRSNIVNYYLDTKARSPESLRDAQRDDPDCKYLINLLLTSNVGNPQTPGEWRRAHWGLREARLLHLHDGLLYRLDPPNDDVVPRRRLYVPHALQWPMLTAFHNHLGHQGYTRMEPVMKQRYYWPGMMRSIQ